ncbi:hypothetical protein AB6D33_24920 [Vibrio splendidus]
MKTTLDILPSHSVAFNAGQAGKFFILREASQSIILQGDTLRPVELERGDVVDVSQFNELTLTNAHTTSLHVEYQVADVEVRIRTASTAINGALDINAVHSPITIDRIQEPFDVQVHIPEVEVNIPDVQVEIPDVNVSLPEAIQVGNFPTVQQVEVTNPSLDTAPELHALPTLVISGPQSIEANPNRKGLIVIAPESNTGTILVAGFIPIKAGGSATLPSSNSITVTGNDNDALQIGEVL